MLTREASLPRMTRVSYRRRRGLWRLVLVGVMLVIFANYISPVKSYLERTGQIDQESAVTQDLRDQHEELIREREKLQNNSYVEEVARRDLGLVRPGEQPFVVKDLDKGSEAAAPSVPAVEEPSLWRRAMDWVGSLMS